MNIYRFDLYIAGGSSRSRRAVKRMREICEGPLRGRSRLDIIDVLEQPQEAEGEKIIVTPTLVKREPAPELRILGDLTDRDALLRALDLESAEPEAFPGEAEPGATG